MVLQTIGRGLGLLFVVIATRILVPQSFSRYSVVSSLVLFGTVLADFGTTPVVVRRVSRRPGEAREVLATALPLSLLLGAFGYVLALGFALVSYQGANLVDVALGGLAIPATSVLTTLQAALDGAGLITRRSLISFSSVLIVAGGGTLGLLVTRDVQTAVAALAIGPIVALASAVVVAQRAGLVPRRLTTSLGQANLLIGAALPFAALGCLSAIAGRFDVLFVSIVSSREETAAYDLALRATEAATYMSSALAASSLVLLARRVGGSDIQSAQRAFDHVVRMAYLLGIPMSGFMVGASESLATSLFGRDYNGVAVLLAILGSSLWLTFVALAQGTLIAAGDHVRRSLWTVAAITGFYLVLDLALIPAYGSRGAAVATTMTQIATVPAFARFHRKTTGIRTRLPHIGVVLGGVGSGTVAFLLRTQPIALVASASVLAYIVLIAALGAVSVSDFRFLRRMFARSNGFL